MKKFFLFTFLFLFFLLNAGAVFALEIEYPTILGFSVNETSTLPEYARYFFNLGVYMAGGIATMVLAFGGIYYLISYFSGKFKDEAKDWMKAGLTGLLLILGAWLIAFTINPDLVKFRLDELPPNYFEDTPLLSVSDNIKVTTYSAVPIGISTENLLARSINCYDFDTNGDPIAAMAGQTNSGPTYKDHDRVDCLLKLLDGAQKKTQIISKLSVKITGLMAQCTCKDNCKTNCGACNDYTGQCPAAEGTTPKCTSPCNEDSCGPLSKECCPVDVKRQIEHGPIKIKLEIKGSPYPPWNCSGLEKEYKGLDEFRSQYVLEDGSSNVKNIFEIEDSNGIINLSAWSRASLIEQLAYFNEKIEEIKEAIKSDSQALQKNKETIENAQCYLTTSYADLIKKANSTNPEDETLKMADKTDFSKYCKGFNYGASSCYKSCQDMCPDSSPAALSSYAECGSCNPDDSACLIKQTACIDRVYKLRPCTLGDSSKNFTQCIIGCKTQCALDCSKKYLVCSDMYKICQDQCKDDSACIISNKLAYYTEGSCQTNSDCPKDCSTCPKDKDGKPIPADDCCAKGTCESVGSAKVCAYNEDKCLINAEKFQECGAKQTDTGNAKYCIDTSFLCKYGSSEYSGYYNCLDPKKISPAKCPADKFSSSFLYQNPECQQCQTPYAEIKGKNTTCLELNPLTSKCPASSKCPNCPCDIIDKTFNFFIPIQESPCPGGAPLQTCSNGTQSCDCKEGPCPGGAPLKTCADGTKSCNCPGVVTPATSECECAGGTPGTPSCYKPCSTHKECNAAKKCVTIQSPGNDTCGENNDCQGTNIANIFALSISEYRITGPQCMEYGYNDDPLTFFCESAWWKDPNREGLSPTPIGDKRSCPKESEIPVGQTIDNAINWSKGFLDTVDATVTEKLKEEIKELNKLGKATNYCQCGSRYDVDPENGELSGKPICKSECKFSQTQVSVPITDPETGEPGTRLEWQCKCIRIPCDGNPCQQMMKNLAKVTDSSAQLKMAYINFFKFYIENGLSARGEVLKQLTYSRQKTTACSTEQNNFGNETRLLDCTRVEHELIPPTVGGNATVGGKTIESFCYGKELGKVLNKPLTDDWFCCEIHKQEGGSSGGDF